MGNFCSLVYLLPQNEVVTVANEVPKATLRMHEEEMIRLPIKYLAKCTTRKDCGMRSTTPPSPQHPHAVYLIWEENNP